MSRWNKLFLLVCMMGSLFSSLAFSQSAQDIAQLRKEILAKVKYKNQTYYQNFVEAIDFLSQVQGSGSTALHRWLFEGSIGAYTYLKYINKYASEIELVDAPSKEIFIAAIALKEKHKIFVYGDKFIKDNLNKIEYAALLLHEVRHLNDDDHGHVDCKISDGKVLDPMSEITFDENLGVVIPNRVVDIDQEKACANAWHDAYGASVIFAYNLLQYDEKYKSPSADFVSLKRVRDNYFSRIVNVRAREIILMDAVFNTGTPEQVVDKLWSHSPDQKNLKTVFNFMNKNMADKDPRKEIFRQTVFDSITIYINVPRADFFDQDSEAIKIKLFEKMFESLSVSFDFMGFKLTDENPLAAVFSRPQNVSLGIYDKWLQVAKARSLQYNKSFEQTHGCFLNQYVSGILASAKAVSSKDHQHYKTQVMQLSDCKTNEEKH